MNELNKRIVICGSMSFYGDMLRSQKLLFDAGIPAIIPPADDDLLLNMSGYQFNEYKRKTSFQYLKKIRDPRTLGILAVNLDKHNILNYVGPNTFAEIAIAFAQRKGIYLLSGIPDIYEDELIAWHAIPLHGSLDRLIDNYRVKYEEETNQMHLFSDL